MPSVLDAIFVAAEKANLQAQPPVVGDIGSPEKSKNGLTKEGEPKSDADVTSRQQPPSIAIDPSLQVQPQGVKGTGSPEEPNAEQVKDGDSGTEPGKTPSSAANSADGQEPADKNPISTDFVQSATRTNSDVSPTGQGFPGSDNPWIKVAMALLGAIIGGAVGNYILDVLERAARKWDEMQIGDKVSLFLGVFAGIVASIPFQNVFQRLGSSVGSLLTFFVVVAFSGIAIFALRSMEEVLPWQRNSGPRRKTGKKILDTNVIIDGRVLDVARSGFLEGEIIVPKFVIEELQHIADSSDSLRRQRGRRGLEVLKVLQADYGLVVDEAQVKDPKTEVDAMLVNLAKSLGGDLVSNDFNLNKVASLQDVRVLNINDLALSLRSNILPGEQLKVTVIREGNQPGQGVGYLDDGTMVVVEDGRSHIGENVGVNVTQVIQTERGKMIFGDSPTPCNGSRKK